MNIQFEFPSHSTILGQKIPVKGFSLLECLIGMFILSLIIAAVLPHQHLLIRTQKQHVDSWERQHQTHNTRLMTQLSQP